MLGLWTAIDEEESEAGIHSPLIRLASWKRSGLDSRARTSSLDRCVDEDDEDDEDNDDGAALDEEEAAAEEDSDLVEREYGPAGGLFASLIEVLNVCLLLLRDVLISLHLLNWQCCVGCRVRAGAVVHLLDRILSILCVGWNTLL